MMGFLLLAMSCGLEQTWLLTGKWLKTTALTWVAQMYQKRTRVGLVENVINLSEWFQVLSCIHAVPLNSADGVESLFLSLLFICLNREMQIFLSGWKGPSCRGLLLT